MKRAVLLAVALLGLAGCGSTTTTVIERSSPAPAPAVTVTRTAAARPAPAVTRTVTSAPPAGTVECWSYEGAAYLSSPGVGYGPVVEDDCTVTFTPVIPYSLGEVTITVTAPPPAAATSSWTIPSD